MTRKPSHHKGTKAKKASTADLLLAWYDKHRRDLPWRAKPGETADPYRVWLSEIMLQQTTVAAVAPYYRAFLKRWPDRHESRRCRTGRGLRRMGRARLLLAGAQSPSRGADHRARPWRPVPAHLRRLARASRHRRLHRWRDRRHRLRRTRRRHGRKCRARHRAAACGRRRAAEGQSQARRARTGAGARRAAGRFRASPDGPRLQRLRVQASALRGVSAREPLRRPASRHRRDAPAQSRQTRAPSEARRRVRGVGQTRRHLSRAPAREGSARRHVPAAARPLGFILPDARNRALGSAVQRRLGTQARSRAPRLHAFRAGARDLCLPFPQDGRTAKASG